MEDDFWKAMLASVARKAMFGAATYLTAKGVLASGDQSQFVNVGVGIALRVASLVWDWYKNTAHAALKQKIETLTKTDTQQAGGR